MPHLRAADIADVDAHRVAELETALRQSERRLREFLEIGSEWIWETDAELRFTHFAGGFRPGQGLTAADFIGKRREELVASPSPEMMKHLADLRAHRPFRDFVYDLETPSGRRYFKISGNPRFDEQGRFCGYFGAGSEITAEITAKLEAEKIHKTYREALENVPASIMLHDADDRLVLCNSITAHFFPHAAHLLIPGVSFEELIRVQATGDRVQLGSSVEAWVQQRLEQHRNPRGSVLQGYTEGRWFHIIEHRTSDGGIIGVRIDVSELKHRERALAEKSALLEATLESVTQGICVIDGGMRLAAWNGRFLESMDYPRELARIGAPFADFIRCNAERGLYGPGEVEELVAERVAFLKNPEAHTYERRAPDGRVLEIKTTPMPEGGFVMTHADVTAYKRAEAALAEQARALEAHSEELKRSNAELEQFAYIASHDLQEPLRMVASYCQLLQRRYKGRLDADADEFIGFAVEGASRMQAMINDLLNYSRVGRKGKGFERLASRETVEAALANLRVALAESGAEVSLGDLPVVEGERALLVRLFQNLIGNAIKFRREEQLRITIEAEPDSDGWIFSLADNGIGIAPEYLERIFLIFQRLHERNKYPGTGIGLAICKKVVEHHGGRIWVESEPGRGSTFKFRLPMRSAPAGEEP